MPEQEPCVEPIPFALDVTLFAAEREYLISAAGALAQQQACRSPLLLSVSRTDRRTNTRPLIIPCSVYYAGSVNKHTHTQTHTFNGPLSGTTRVSRYQKGEWQWNQLGRMQVCTSLQTDNHASTPLLSFLQTGCPSCRPTNSVKALKAKRCQ